MAPYKTHAFILKRIGAKMFKSVFILVRLIALWQAVVKPHTQFSLPHRFICFATISNRGGYAHNEATMAGCWTCHSLHIAHVQNELSVENNICFSFVEKCMFSVFEPQQSSFKPKVMYILFVCWSSLKCEVKWATFIQSLLSLCLSVSIHFCGAVCLQL